MSIPIISNFEVSISKPIDARFTVSDITERNNITFKYSGMVVHVDSDDTLYYLSSDGVTWIPINITNIDNGDTTGQSLLWDNSTNKWTKNEFFFWNDLSYSGGGQVGRINYLGESVIGIFEPDVANSINYGFYVNKDGTNQNNIIAGWENLSYGGTETNTLFCSDGRIGLSYRNLATSENSYVDVRSSNRVEILSEIGSISSSISITPNTISTFTDEYSVSSSDVKFNQHIKIGDFLGTVSASEGMIRKNTTYFQGYDGTNWNPFDNVENGSTINELSRWNGTRWESVDSTIYQNNNSLSLNYGLYRGDNIPNTSTTIEGNVLYGEDVGNNLYGYGGIINVSGMINTNSIYNTSTGSQSTTTLTETESIISHVGTSSEDAFSKYTETFLENYYSDGTQTSRMVYNSDGLVINSTDGVTSRYTTWNNKGVYIGSNQTYTQNEMLEIDGRVVIDDSTETPVAGALRWDSTNFQGYDGSQWNSFGNIDDGTSDGQTILWNNSIGRWNVNNFIVWEDISYSGVAKIGRFDYLGNDVIGYYERDSVNSYDYLNAVDISSTNKITIGRNNSNFSGSESNIFFCNETEVGILYQNSSTSETNSLEVDSNGISASLLDAVNSNTFVATPQLTRFSNNGFLVDITDAKLDIDGALVIGNLGSATPEDGMLRWDGDLYQGYNGSNWDNLNSSVINRTVIDTSVNTTYTVQPQDNHIDVNINSASLTITLQAVSNYSESNVFIIKCDGNASSSNTVTIQTTGSETIEGDSSIVLNQPYEEVKIRVFNGTSEFVTSI